MNGSAIEWLPVESAAECKPPAPGVAFARILIADLRDPRVLSLLRPAPVASDYCDEARPGASDRSYFLARRAALRSLVGLQTGHRAEDVLIGYDAPGAPRVRAPEGIFVSVSGRGPLAALAVANAPVGVDIELCSASVDIIEDVLHVDERQQLAMVRADEQQAEFLRIWTAKEAFLKALGTGLNIEPASIAISLAGDSVSAIRLEGKTMDQAGRLSEIRLDGVRVIAACIRLNGTH